VLGALPDALIIAVSGLGGSREVVAKQARAHSQQTVKRHITFTWQLDSTDSMSCCCCCCCCSTVSAAAAAAWQVLGSALSLCQPMRRWQWGWELWQAAP
jgi:fructoselysine-6-P-deglycase FrlB-like protein